MDDKTSAGSVTGKGLMTRREVLKAAGAAGVMAVVPTSMTRSAFGASAAKRLTLAVPGGPQSIEPHLEGADVWQRRKPLIYENLVWIDYDMQPKPQLATSWEMPNPTTYVFNLRKGVKFHNGNEMTAEDVKYSYDRVIDPKVGSGGRGDLIAVDTIEVVNKYAVRFKLKFPSGPFVAALGGKYNGVIPKDFVKTGNELRAAACGTGPFKLEKFEPTSVLHVSRFDGYWDRASISLDEIRVMIVPDESSIVAGLRSGTIDIAAFEDTKNYFLVQKEKNLDTYRSPSVRWEVLDLVSNTAPDKETGKVTEYPTSDFRVCQAIKLCIDKEAILQVAGNGIGQPLGMLPPALKLWTIGRDELPLETRDVARAKQLLKETRYGSGLELTIRNIVGYPQLAAAVQIIAENCAEAGIKVKIDTVDVSIWIKDWLAGKSPCTMNSWGGLIDPDLALYRHFHSAPGGYDPRRFGNPYTDALLDEGRRAMDLKHRQAIYRAVQMILAQMACTIPLYSADMVYAAQKHVKNLRLHPTGFFYGIRNVKLEKA
jgi:peptide/nickel transport system substrate-binding protein